jgi:hypothetical protein
MRLSNDHLIEPDLVDHVDLHASTPANLNSRITDLGTSKTIEARLGVYIHWTIPQFYRLAYSGAGASADPATQAERKRQVILFRSTLFSTHCLYLSIIIV